MRICSILSIKFLCIVTVLLLVACGHTGGSVGVNDSPVNVPDRQKALDSHVTLARAYLQRGELDAARRNFKKALRIDRRSHEAHNGMGTYYTKVGENQLAEESFKEALRINRNFTQARVDYGRFLFRQQRYQEAFEQFDRSSQDLSYDFRALSLAFSAQAALKLGKKDHAKANFERALNLNNNLPLAMIELAQLYFDEKDYAKAKRYLDEYSSKAKSSPKSLLLGIKIERIFGNKDREASYALALRNLFPYSKESLEYRKMLERE